MGWTGRQSSLVVAFLVVCSASLPALGLGNEADPAATGLTYGVDAGVGETDNVNFAPSGAVSQTIATVDADVSLKQRTALLEDQVKGQFTFFDYLEHAYGSQLIGRLDGTADVAIVPERVFWFVQDDYGEATLDPFSAPIPTNLEYVNAFSTGPEWELHFGASTFLKLDARYSRVQYQTSPFNNNRFLGSLQLGLSTSARAAISFNATVERVAYQDTLLNTDATRGSFYGEYEIQGARTDVTARLGVTSVDSGGTTTRGSLATLVASRKLSRAATLSLQGGRILTDASASLANLQGGASGAISTSQAAVTSSIYTQTYAQLGWQYLRNRTTLAFSGRWENDTYAGDQPAIDVVGVATPLANLTTDPAALDSSRRGAEFSAEQRMSRSLSLQLLGSYYQWDFPHANYSILEGETRREDSRIGTALVYRKGRGLEVRLRYDHLERVISGVESGTGFKDNTVYLTIGYRPRAPEPVDTLADPAP
jgi:hypothetical protein